MNIEGAPPSTPDDQRPLKRCKTNVETTDPSSAVVTDDLLHILSEIPDDIVVEIFSMVHPLDLLTLARTSKPLRAFFMHPSSLPIWKGALRHRGLPDCTKFISAPGLVHLIYEDFEAHCASCGKKTFDARQTIYWSFFARFCSQVCIMTYFRPYSSQSGYHKYLPYVDLNGDRLYHRKTLNRWRYEYGRLGSNQAKAEWVVAREKVFNERQEIIDACVTWARQLNSRRRDEVVERLTCLGWGKEIALMVNPAQLTEGVFRSECGELNERLWNEVKPRLVHILEKTRADRLERDHVAMLRSRLPLMHQVREAYTLANPVNAIIPPVAELYYFPPFRAVVEEIAPEVVVALEHFREAMNELPTLIPAWVDQMNLKLIDMMEKALKTGEKLEPSCLGRATTLFRCGADSCPRCDGIISYPRVLTHCGATRPPSRYTATKDMFLVNESLGQGLFNARLEISFSAFYYQKAVEVVKLAGLPATATADEMDKLDPVYECVKCSDVNARVCMTWRQAVRHTTAGYHTLSLVLESNICNKARKKFNKYQTDNVWTSGNNLRCVRCRKAGKIAELQQHVKDEHGISEDDIVPDIDASYIPQAVRVRLSTSVWSVRSK